MKYRVLNKNGFEYHCNADHGKYNHHSQGSTFQTTDLNIAHEYKEVLEQQYGNGPQGLLISFWQNIMHLKVVKVCPCGCVADRVIVANDKHLDVCENCESKAIKAAKNECYGGTRNVNKTCEWLELITNISAYL